MEIMRVQYGNSAIDIWPFFIAIVAVISVILGVRKHSLSYLICFAVFGIYLMFALDKVFFPIQISGPYVDARRQYPFISDVNLIPFYFGPSSSLADSLPDLMLNILLTIPFGFGVNFVAPVSAKTFRWLAPAIGLMTEGGHLIISLMLRYAYRNIDITDVLMNASGVLIGYGIFRGFAWLYVVATQRLRIEHKGLAAYVYDIASRR